MNLIKRSDIPQHYEEWMVYDYDAHRKKRRPKSFYLYSKSVNINCYSKYLQLLNRSQENVEKRYAPISPEIIDASRNIIRFEVQCKYHKTYSLSQQAENLGNNSLNKYKSLLHPVKCIEIISSYYKKIIGKRRLVYPAGSCPYHTVKKFQQPKGTAFDQRSKRCQPVPQSG